MNNSIGNRIQRYGRGLESGSEYSEYLLLHPYLLIKVQPEI